VLSLPMVGALTRLVVPALTRRFRARLAQHA
jgi:hypothetical protein